MELGGGCGRVPCDSGSPFGLAQWKAVYLIRESRHSAGCKRFAVLFEGGPYKWMNTLFQVSALVISFVCAPTQSPSKTDIMGKNIF